MPMTMPPTPLPLAPLGRVVARSAGVRGKSCRPAPLTGLLCAKPSPTYGANFTDTSAAGSSLMARQFIYHMHGMTKAYSNGKKVLDNIHLSFYPDAKIGVLRPNR